jgi:hypothetical protein
MTGPSFARRYWRSLTESRADPGSPITGRGRADYSFGQRYWAAFVGVVLPAAERPDIAMSGGHVSSPSQWVRGMQTARPGAGGWFVLPGLGAQVVLRAGDESRVVAEATTQDGRVELFVRLGGTPRRYLLEVVLRDSGPFPAVVFVRYAAAHGERLLLVPLTDAEIGPPSAQVELAGFEAGQRLEVLGPLPADQNADWDADDVEASVSAAASEATRDAWRRLRSSLPSELQVVIDRTMP